MLLGFSLWLIGVYRTVVVAVIVVVAVVVVVAVAFVDVDEK